MALFNEDDPFGWADAQKTTASPDSLANQPLAPTSPRPTNRSRALNFQEFMNAPTVPREALLAPILTRQSLMMIHAKRGVGKTYLSLGIALAVASGGEFLRWKAPEARRVLYLDGEMPARAMQDRLRSLAPPAGFPDDNFCIVSADYESGALPNLSTHEGQSFIEQDVEQADLIVVDNLSTLTRRGNENESESWLPMQQWLLSLRSRGKSVLLVHHSNKTGAQRGTSSREDILDTVIKLAHGPAYEPERGASFVVTFEKYRGLHGDDVTSFETQLSIHDDVAQWTVRALEDTIADEVAELRFHGKSYREIAEILGISKSAVERAYRRQLMREAE